MKLLLLALLLAIAALAQTKTATTQIAVPTVTAPSVLVVLPSGGMALLKLEGFVIDNATTPATLKPNPPVLVFPSVSHERLAAVSGVWSIPKGCELIMLIRNIPQHEGVDYDIEGQAIKWKPASSPTPQDTVSVLCLR